MLGQAITTEKLVGEELCKSVRRRGGCSHVLGADRDLAEYERLYSHVVSPKRRAFGGYDLGPQPDGLNILWLPKATRRRVSPPCSLHQPTRLSGRGWHLAGRLVREATRARKGFGTALLDAWRDRFVERGCGRVAGPCQLKRAVDPVYESLGLRFRPKEWDRYRGLDGRESHSRS